MQEASAPAGNAALSRSTGKTITLAALESEGVTVLRAAGIEDPRLDARLLLRHAAGLSREEIFIHPRHNAAPGVVDRYRDLIRRREAREPIAYLLGHREFWSLDFAVSPAVLIPRPDSETLIEAALSVIPDRAAPSRVLDLGTGSGCLLLALLSELPRAAGVGVDLSEGALAVAKGNAGRLGLSHRARFVLTDWNKLEACAFDIVLANPPYIPEPDLHALERDVRDYEPRGALCGGPDGLDAYGALMPVLGRVLAPHGFAAVELGAGQSGAVSALAVAHGLEVAAVFCDLAGHERCLLLRRSAQKNLLE